MRSIRFKDILYIFLRLRRILFGRDILYVCFNKYCFQQFGKSPGAWTILPILDKNSIVYSVGIGTDISFDLELITNNGITVYAFDPTPKSIDWLNKQYLPTQFLFNPVGLASFDGELKFNLPLNPEHVSASAISNNENDNYFIAKVNRLQTLLLTNGHNNIDLLKIDIEGSEYDVIDDILASKIEIRQLLIEFHHRFKEIGIMKTKSAVAKLKTHGYELVYVNQKTGEEYTFVKQ